MTTTPEALHLAVTRDLELTVVCLREAIARQAQLLTQRPAPPDRTWERNFEEATRYLRRTHAAYVRKMGRLLEIQSDLVAQADVPPAPPLTLAHSVAVL